MAVLGFAAALFKRAHQLDQGFLAVHQLAAVALACDDNSRGLVGKANRRFHLVHILPAGAAASERLKLTLRGKFV